MAKEAFTISGSHHVIDALRENQEVDLLVEGGGQSGVLSAEMLKRLQAHDRLKQFPNMVGVSCGGGNLWFALGGKGESATKIYEEINTDEGIFRWEVDLPPFKMNYAVLERANESDPVDPNVIRATGVNFRFVVTDDEGKPHYLSVDDVENVSLLPVAGVFIPSFGGHKGYQLTNRNYENDQRHYFDGTFSDDIPIEYMVEQLGSRKVLILANENPKRQPPRIPGFLIDLAQRLHPEYGEAYYEALRTYPERRSEAFPYLTGEKTIPGVEITVVHPEKTIVDFKTTNRNRLRQGKEAAGAFIDSLFEK